MIITRTPFRVTLGGGGTDLPSFYGSMEASFSPLGSTSTCISTSTPRSLTTRSVFVHQLRNVDHVAEVKHTLAREALKYFGVTNGIEIVSIADVPAGTGSAHPALILSVCSMPPHFAPGTRDSHETRRRGLPHRDRNSEKAHRQTGPVHGRVRWPRPRSTSSPTVKSTSLASTSTSISSKVSNTTF